jgi:hypothetical protein
MISNRDLLASTAQLTLLVFFGTVGSLHLLSLRGLGPEGFVKFEHDAVVALSKVSFIATNRLPVNLAVPLWASLQLGSSLGLFLNAKRAAILLGLVSIFAAISAHSGVSAAGNTPATLVLAVHAILLALACYVYLHGEPLLPLLKRTASDLTRSGGRSPRATNNPYASRNRSKKD